jgi:hypothetical protein
MLGCVHFAILFAIESNVAYRLGQKTQGKEEKTDDQNKVA